MKKFLTNNIGLKILALLTSVVLWVIVVNIDDPIVYKTFSGIPVEITNTDSLTEDGKTYEIPDGSDMVSVTVQAERSVMENMSKDFIKAYADMKNITIMNTIPIEYKTTRYSDRIKSITSRVNSIPVIVENKKSKQIKVSVASEGKVSDGYIIGTVNPSVSVITVSGPESLVDIVKEASISVDIGAMNESFRISCPVKILDINDEIIDNPMLSVSAAEITTEVEVLETKEIPVTAGFSGTPAAGFSATGIVICDPSSIIVAGKGSAYENLTSVNIPAADVSIEGASKNASMTINIKSYLPKDVILAGDNSSGDINVVALVEAHNLSKVLVPVENIAVINLPEGYSAHVISGEDTLAFDISGLESDLNDITALSFTAVIDAQTLVPRIIDEENPEAPVHTGSNDGLVLLNLPPNVTQVTQMALEVIVSHSGEE